MTQKNLLEERKALVQGAIETAIEALDRGDPVIARRALDTAQRALRHIGTEGPKASA
jgi:hypothetical protein